MCHKNEPIIGILEVFCKPYRQKVNVQKKKTNAFFLANISQNKRHDIIAASGFSATQGLGRYLGSLPHFRRIKKESFKDIIQKLFNKLAGWKSNCLSMVVRVSFAQSVIGTIASYTMQNTKIPSSICKEIERMQRDFVWGSSLNA